MKVREFIKKWKINETDVEIYVNSRDDIEWRDIYQYFEEEVLDWYPHHERTVLVVK